MEIIILMGLQASGKSTFFRTHFAETHDHISKDLLPNTKHRATRQHQLIEEAFQMGHSIVVDNTNVTKEERQALIEPGRTYGAKIIGYYFEVQVSRSLERNKLRTGKARVPDVAIFATLKKLVRPAYAEGFDELFYVCNSGNDMTFEISHWRDEEVAEGG